MSATELKLRSGARVRPLAAAAMCFALGLMAASGARAQRGVEEPCGSLRNHYGPFDYRTNRGPELEIVENAHFDAGVESLTKPRNTTTHAMAGDVGYTLHVFPNHHRALIAMMRLGERHKAEAPPGAAYTVECYFIRAVRFRPDDTVARGLYARYLAKNNRKEDAVRQLEAATGHAGDNALSHFNIGLIYYELGRYDLALKAAHRARELGLQRQELANLLKRANKWQESST